MLDNEKLNSIGFRWVTDHIEVMTPYGEALARRPHYYARSEAEALLAEQRSVEELRERVRSDPGGVNALLRLLMPIKDVRRSIDNLSVRTLSEVELFEVKRFLLQLELIAPQAAALRTELCGARITALPGALDLIDPDGTRSPSFYVSDRLSPALADIRRERRLIDEQIKRLGLSDELMAARTRAAAREEEENARVRKELCERLREYRAALLENADSIGRLDFALGKARLAESFGCVNPSIGGEIFSLHDMTDPKFAEALHDRGRAFVPVSMELVRGSVVVTGANMGGKSIAMKTLALNVFLAMCGFPVFAKEARLPFIDDIFLMTEDREDAMSGLSSFGGEMKAFDEMLKETAEKRNVLVLLDEFARGTNPHEGAALVKAAARLFNARENTFAVIATHFDGVARLARLHYQVAGLRNADADAIRARLKNGSADLLAEFMDYGLCPVAPDEEPPRDAVTIIRALGVSPEFADLIDV